MTDLPAPAATLTVWHLGPVWGTPSASPFVIKLMTWLRMAQIPYRDAALTRPPRSPTGKIPYVELADGTLLYDSGLIIEALAQRFRVDLDADLDGEARACGHAVRRMVEEHLYWAGVYDRWISDAGFPHTARDYFRALPPVLRDVVPRLVHRKIRAALHGQGLGRHRPEDIARAGAADLAALSALLGDRPFLLGRPSTVDATVFAFLWAFTANPFESNVGRLAQLHPNLLAYVGRMRQRYWGE